MPPCTMGLIEKAYSVAEGVSGLGVLFTAVLSIWHGHMQ